MYEERSLTNPNAPPQVLSSILNPTSEDDGYAFLAMLWEISYRDEGVPGSFVMPERFKNLMLPSDYHEHKDEIGDDNKKLPYPVTGFDGLQERIKDQNKAQDTYLARGIACLGRLEQLKKDAAVSRDRVEQLRIRQIQLVHKLLEVSGMVDCTIAYGSRSTEFPAEIELRNQIMEKTASLENQHYITSRVNDLLLRLKNREEIHAVEASTQNENGNGESAQGVVVDAEVQEKLLNALDGIHKGVSALLTQLRTQARYIEVANSTLDEFAVIPKK